MAIKSRSSDGAVQNAVSQVDSMHFFNLLTSPELPDELGTLLPECRERRYPPAVALAMFLGQVSSADGSCQNAVNEAVVSRLLSGPQVQSTTTGAYRMTRERLPQEMVRGGWRAVWQQRSMRTPRRCGAGAVGL